MVKLTRTQGETPPCVTETEESSRSSSVISSQDGHNQPTVDCFSLFPIDGSMRQCRTNPLETHLVYVVK
jgi:hypothetical protein